MPDFIFRVHGDEYCPASSTGIVPKLPPGNYLVTQQPLRPLFLSRIDDFVVPKKIYGSARGMPERILTTFKERGISTGVLLAGIKGSGKSLIAKLTAKLSGLPVLLVNNPYSGDDFNTLIQMIHQPAVVLFDEFEKVYATITDGEGNEHRQSQQQILTLLDGVFPSQKLFIFTCNDLGRLDENFHNRPGRLFYSLDFDGLDVESVVEYCKENLEQTRYIDEIVNIAKVYTHFNFDMLQALVHEMNRYKEDPYQAIQYLNIRILAHDMAGYSAMALYNKKHYGVRNWSSWDNPLASFEIDCGVNDGEKDVLNGLTQDDLVEKAPDLSVIVYEKNKVRVTFTRINTKYRLRKIERPQGA